MTRLNGSKAKNDPVIVSISCIIATFPTNDGLEKWATMRKNSLAVIEFRSVVARNFNEPVNGFMILN